MSNIKNVDPRNDFPIFSVKSNSNLVYLDSAATTFKPKCVLDVMKEYTKSTHQISIEVYIQYL